MTQISQEDFLESVTRIAGSVYDFHSRFGIPAISVNGSSDAAFDRLRTRLAYLVEESGEHSKELNQGNLQDASEELAELALGGTAVGTGINTHPDFAGRTIALVSEELGVDFREAENHFEAQAAKDAAVSAAGALNTIATSFFKIADDVRCGLGDAPGIKRNGRRGLSYRGIEERS